MSKILLLDSNSLLYRAYYALPSMQNALGESTAAIYGFISMLARLLREERPTHIAAVFDHKGKVLRQQVYPEYKATRKPMPDDLVVQVPYLYQLLENMGIKILSKEGYEADDIIGTIAKRFNINTIILTGDRDCLQLVDNSTTVYYTLRGVTNVKKYTLNTLAQEGLTPQAVIEYKAIAGDKSDNIPGATGVGDVSAKKLLTQFENIETLYENIEQVKGSLKDKMLASKDIVFLSKKLATIDTLVPIECTLDNLTFDNILDKKALENMQQLGFRSLIERFEFKQAENEPKIEQPVIKAIELTSIDILKEIVERNKDSKQFALSINSKVNFAFNESLEYTILCAQSYFDAGPGIAEVLETLSPLLNAECQKVFYDIKEMYYLAKEKGCSFDYNRQGAEDILLKAYLVNSIRAYKSLEHLLEDYGLDKEYPSVYMLKLNRILDDLVRQYSLEDLYYNIELPLIDVLYEIEQQGFAMDINMLKELSVQYEQELAVIVKKIHELAGEEFNINSNQQLGNILFEKLGLPKSKKNKMGYTVTAETLEQLEHPIIELLLRHREITKLKSTYLDGLYNFIDKSTGKLHTKFKQCLTATGRLSSVEPNLQNIPTRTKEGRSLRKMFVASAECILLSADYSQIELRLLAHLSGDENLLHAYRNGIDIHRLTAAKVSGVNLEDVTSDMRRAAKEINFGIIYGISEFGLARVLNISRQGARLFQERYFETYPAVKGYMQSNVEKAKEKGYIRTIKGRIRLFPELASRNFNIRSFGERAAMNMPLQGSSADIIKIAMIRLSARLKQEGLKARIILQVHDELIIDCPIAEQEQVAQLAYTEMKNAVQLSIPLEVEVHKGVNWFEAS